jgi:hypothetical protein
MTKFEHKADPTLLPGERLLWQGRQWYVSNRGLGAIRTASYPGHWFDRDQIDRGPTNYRNPAVPYSMLSHIADKDEPDLDLEDFIEAFQVACHWFHRDLRSGWLHREIANCRQLSPWQGSRMASE